MLETIYISHEGIWSSRNKGKILLGGNCPFVLTKKLSGQKKFPDKKLSGQKNCPDKIIVQTKKWSGQFFLSQQKNCPDKFFLSALTMPLFFFCPSGSWFFVLSNFCPIVQQRHGTYFRNILQFLWNIMGPSNHNLSHKTLNQVTKHSTQSFIS